MRCGRGVRQGPLACWNERDQSQLVPLRTAVLLEVTLPRYFCPTLTLDGRVHRVLCGSRAGQHPIGVTGLPLQVLAEPLVLVVIQA